ncbi:MAG: triphosphoribosyl-dephospho-CoA synthase, partial [Candidatus Hydrothermarchaeaceae archaeon]
AIRLVEPGGLGEVGYLDVRNRDSERIIEAKKMNLYDIMKLTKGDSIAMELTNKMKVSFEIGYPAIVDAYRETKDISKAILQGFMNILSMVPDSLIARKRGRRTADKVSEEARSILETGFDRERLASFDKKLRDKNNALNPGATADLTASSLMIAVLNGLRP